MEGRIPHIGDPASPFGKNPPNDSGGMPYFQ